MNDMTRRNKTRPKTMYNISLWLLGSSSEIGVTALLALADFISGDGCRSLDIQ
jgi:hypothetical protein